jgi:hypothetical protein
LAAGVYLFEAPNPPPPPYYTLYEYTDRHFVSLSVINLEYLYFSLIRR